ncbi:MAG: phosphoribosylformylglycinamidine cyclo-ligase [Acidiferrobacterales bacterium]
MSESSRTPLSYRGAGVDIDAGDALVRAIKPVAKSTARPGVLGELGGFGGLFEIPARDYEHPVLVASTDGVGTKLKLALELDRHQTIGIDLVAMCANDIIVQGAEPLFFLDYLAAARLDVSIATRVIQGIAEGCRLAGVALIGGETAEMPGLYSGADYDLAGFAVGIVERTKIIDGSAIGANDVLVGIASSGPHANGFSLIRKILERSRTPLDTPFAGTTLGDALLTPTRIYCRSLLMLLQAQAPLGMAHVTGGGLPGNVPRVLPKGVQAVIDARTWRRPAIFDWVQENGDIEDDEMYRTFNCGIGMVLVVRDGDEAATIQVLRESGETAFVIGHTEAHSADKQMIILR